MLNSTDTTSADQFGTCFHAELHVTNAPRGRAAGLFGALAGAVCPVDTRRALPLTDLAALTQVGTMFDYDASQAIELDGAFG